MNTTKLIMIMIMLLVIWGLFIALFFFITNKVKHKKIISKIIVFIILGISFYKIYTGVFEKIELGIFSGALFLGLTWGAIWAVWQKHIFNTIQILLLCCVIGWLFSFIIACFEFADIPFTTSMRTVSLIGIVLSAISTIFSSGQLFSLDSSNYENYIVEDSTPKVNKKIRATTYDYGLFKETTYKDEDGNKTTVEHWKF